MTSHSDSGPANDTLTAQASAFLRGTKTAEALSPTLASAIYVERNLASGESLAQTLGSALIHGQNVVITGSAGGGKTMLLDRIREWLRLNASPEIDFQFIPDFTAAGESQEQRVELLRRCMDRGPTLIAANEGPLLGTLVREVLTDVIPILRGLQQGEPPSASENGSFTVVDLAALDPVSPAVSSLLTNSVLREAVEAIECDVCEQYRVTGSCPRMDALAQLDLPGVAGFVEYVVQLGTSAREVIFRHVWDFIADMLIGGSCEGSTPTSPWFWRLFFGDTEIAKDIRSALKPEFLTIPRGLPYLYQGDWTEVEIWRPEIGQHLVDSGAIPARLSEEKSSELMLWFKVQLTVLLRALGHDLPRFPGEDSSSLEREVLVGGRLDRLLQHLNAYFMREKVDANTPTSLSLWVDTTGQRMDKRPTSMVAIGVLPESAFELRRSRVLSERPSSVAAGSRAFLALRSLGEASLPLSPNLFDALTRGRPLSTRVRSFDDVDFAIRNFYLLACGSDQVSNPNAVSLLDSNEDTATTSSWRIQQGAAIDPPIVR